MHNTCLQLETQSVVEWRYVRYCHAPPRHARSRHTRCRTVRYGAGCGVKVRLVDSSAVSSRVFGEVVATHEAFVALDTRELLLAGVCSDVPLQLVRSHEPLATEQPVTDERPLAAVPAQVCLEM